MTECNNPDKDIENIVYKYSDMLFRICLVILKNEADAQDAVQETFLKYIQKAPIFNNSEHEKAWLIKVATNLSKNMLKKRTLYLDTEPQKIKAVASFEDTVCIFEVLSKLPHKYSVVIILHYIDGYKVNEIAEYIGKTPSAIKMRLQKGRKLIEKIYKEEM